MLLPVAHMYYVNSTALLIKIPMLVGAELLTCALTMTQHSNQTLYTVWKEEKQDTSGQAPRFLR